MKKLVFVLFLAFIVFSGFSAANPGPNSCGILNESYSLTEDIVSQNGTCFTIDADNITLDCQGHTVTFAANASMSGRALENFGHSRVVVRNCKFIQGDGGIDQTAVYLKGNQSLSEYSTNEIRVRGRYALLLEGYFADSVIQSSMIASTNSTAVLLNNTVEASFFDNFVSSGPVPFSSAFLFDGFNFRNKFLRNNISANVSAFIFLKEGTLAEGNTISTNTIRAVGDWNYALPAIYLFNGRHNLIEENTFYSTSGAVSIGSLRGGAHPSFANILRRNRFVAGPAVYLSDSKNDLIEENEMTGGTAALVYDSEGIEILRNKIVCTTDNAIVLSGANHSRLMQNVIFCENSGGIIAYGGSNNSFLNNSIRANNSIEIYDGDENILSGNVVGASERGIYISNSNENEISNNAINSSLGVLTEYSQRNKIVGNVILSEAGILNGRESGLDFVDSNLIMANYGIADAVGPFVGGHIITRNKIILGARNGWGYGITVGGNNVTISKNEIYGVEKTFDGYLISLLDSRDSIVSENMVKGIGNTLGISLVGSNLSIKNNHISGVGSGLWTALSYDVVFSNNTIVNAQKGLVVLEAGYIYVIDSKMTANEYAIEIEGNIAFPSNVTLVNTSFNKSAVRFWGNYSFLNVSWYLDAGVFGKGGVAFPNASVLVKNKDGIVYSGFTDASGRIPTQTLVEYVQTAQGKNYSSPYVVSAQYKDKCDYRKTALEESTAIKLFPSRPCLSLRG